MAKGVGRKPLLQFVAPLSRCGYLPDRDWQLAYEVFGRLTREEYHARLLAGWRRFGHTLFRPQCPDCQQCQSLRVPVGKFLPNRNQRRVRKANEGELALTIGRPAVDAARLALYDRFHAFQSDAKGWPEHAGRDAADYAHSFVENPFPTEEWTYRLGDRLLGVGYVDVLPDGLSAIYFYYDPDERDRSPGTWNVLQVIEQAQLRGMEYVYLGFYVPGCRSLEYKANFAPNQVLRGGEWRDLED